MSIPAPTVTVSSGYWNNTYPTSYHRNSTEREVGRILARPSNRGLRRVMRALNGVAPGAAVVETFSRIAAPAPFNLTGMGGLRTVETITGVHNGVTTTAQRDYINTQVLDPVVAQQTYPVDLSGNGGGGKVQR